MVEYVERASGIVNETQTSYVAKPIVVTGGSGFIGSFLISALIDRGYTVINIDTRALESQNEKITWLKCDIGRSSEVVDYIKQANPSAIFHLAATTLASKECFESYRGNLEATRVIIKAAKTVSNLRLLVHISSMLVVRLGARTTHPYDIVPHNSWYARVKAEEECEVRDSKLPWVVIRPTNVWGPRHPRFGQELWRYLRNRWYLHPTGEAVRSYMYVGNAAWQLAEILGRHPSELIGKVFYLTDPPISSSIWLNTFSRELSGKPVREIPRSLLQLMASFGQLLNNMGIKFPLHMDRYRSMTSDYMPPECCKSLESLTGRGPFGLEDGVRESCEWFAQKVPG